MANSWLRLWHDMPNDPKWRSVARAAKQPIPSVIAVYLHLLVNASNATERGRTQSVQNEDIASALDLEEGQVDAIIAAMQGRVLDGDVISGWSKRQAEREDGGAERARAWREKKKQEEDRTQANASERKRTPDKDKDKDKELNTDTTRISSLSKLTALGVDEQIAKDWLQIRKVKKLPLTDTALNQIKKEAELVNRTLPEIIEVCAKNNWGGFKAEWKIPDDGCSSKPFDMNEFMKKANGL